MLGERSPVRAGGDQRRAAVFHFKSRRVELGDFEFLIPVLFGLEQSIEDGE